MTDEKKNPINGHYKHEKTRGELVVNFTWISRVIRELCLVGDGWNAPVAGVMGHSKGSDQSQLDLIKD